MTHRDGVLDELILLAGLAVFSVAAWFLAGDYLAIGASAASAALSLPMAWAGDMLGSVRLPLLTDWLIAPSQEARDLWLGLRIEEIPSHSATICMAGGRNAALVVTLLYGRAAIAATGFRPDYRFRGGHDLDSMVRAQARVWPAADRPSSIDPSRETAPETGDGSAEHARLREQAVERGVVETGAGGEADETLPETGSVLLPEQVEPLRPPPLGRALRPEEWLDALSLRSPDGEEIASHAVESGFARQLTRQWRGPDLLRAHEQAFAACLGQFALEGPGRAGELIDELGRAFARVERQGGCAEALAGKPELSRTIACTLERTSHVLDELATGHWWVESALVEIWNSGRKGGGVLAPARFLWLKPEDRSLWYAIQTFGGNPVVEAAGIRAHHLAEQQYGFALVTPHVRFAVNALLNVYMDRDSARLEAREKREGEIMPILAEQLTTSQ